MVIAGILGLADDLYGVFKKGPNGGGLNRKCPACNVDVGQPCFGRGDYGSEFHTMRRDGYTPRVEQEPDIEDVERKRAVLALLGDDEYVVEEEQGMSPYTVIVHGAIPPKYLRLVSG